MLLLIIVLTLLERSHSHSTGAPAAACVNVYPIGHANNTESQDLDNNPFHLDFSDLDHSYGGSVYFVPGQTYNMTLSGSGDHLFRGFLVQARSVADGSPVGVFTDNGDDQILSSCSPPESAVTHPNRDLKSVVTLLWTAPPDGSHHLHLLYAVVSEFSNGSNTFWAPAMTDTVLSCGSPLYQHQGRCVEVCPYEHFGNSTSGHCQPYANNYILSMNATQYYVHLTSETPVNTTVFRMQLSINLDTELSNIITISMTFSQNILVQNLFEFVNGSENEFDATNHVQPITANSGIVDASIYLVKHGTNDIYPIEIAMTVTALLVFTNSQGTTEPKSATAMAVGSIVLAPGACDFIQCENGGTCMDTNSTHFTCMCPPDFTGLRCNDSIIIDNVCQLSQPCIHGTCDAINNSMIYTCSCDSGYTGFNCTEHICEQITCTHGTCVFMETDGNYTCMCDSGYTGVACDEVINDDCYYSGCNENGNCTNNNDNTSMPYCVCLPGWTGMSCDTYLVCDSNPCENNATCVSHNDTFTCVCTPGWTGLYCETQLINECDENPCFNNAICYVNCLDNEECLTGENQQSYYECQCLPGYTGDTCNNDDPTMTFCEPNSCANSGTCIEEYGPDTSCLCTNGFSGPTCTEEIIMSSSDSCSQPLINDNVLIALICAVTSIIIVIVIGSLITIGVVMHYKAKAKTVARTTFTNSLNLSDSRVFPNTNTETGIYFDPIPSNERTLRPTANNESTLRLSSSPINLPLLQSRLRQESGTGSSPQSRETVPEQRTFLASDTMSQTTAASDYEQPVFTMRQHWNNNMSMSQQNSSQVNFVSSQYETVC